MSVLRVLLGGLAPLLWMPDWNQSQVTWTQAPAVLYTWLPVATGWHTFGESCHGVCKASLPSPGDWASWGEKEQEKTQKKIWFEISCVLGVWWQNTRIKTNRKPPKKQRKKQEKYHFKINLAAHLYKKNNISSSPMNDNAYKTRQPISNRTLTNYRNQV